MDPFFEIPEPVTRVEPDPPPEPPWAGPPEDVLAALVPERHILWQTDRLTVMLSHVDAFPTGALFHLRMVAQRTSDMLDDEWHRIHETVFDHGESRTGTTLPDEFFRVGVGFADGRRVTNIGWGVGAWSVRRGQSPKPPSLVEIRSGGSGSNRSISARKKEWLWPLPPPERFDLVIEWPALGVPVTRAAIDGAAIVTAAENVVPLWSTGAEPWTVNGEP
ncbi:MAG: hypothetical protein ACFCVC_02530 [Acidimicrobiia bacterium]